MRRFIVVLMLTVGACAAPTTEMEACPATGCAPVNAAESQPPDTLKRQASFDLKCDAAQLSFTAIGDSTIAQDVRSWGVRGCGKQASYALESRCGGYAAETCSWHMSSPLQPSS